MRGLESALFLSPVMASCLLALPVTEQGVLLVLCSWAKTDFWYSPRWESTFQLLFLSQVPSSLLSKCWLSSMTWGPFCHSTCGCWHCSDTGIFEPQAFLDKMAVPPTSCYSMQLCGALPLWFTHQLMTVGWVIRESVACSHCCFWLRKTLLVQVRSQSSGEEQSCFSWFSTHQVSYPSSSVTRYDLWSAVMSSFFCGIKSCFFFFFSVSSPMNVMWFEVCLISLQAVVFRLSALSSREAAWLPFSIPPILKTPLYTLDTFFLCSNGSQLKAFTPSYISHPFLIFKVN